MRNTSTKPFYIDIPFTGLTPAEVHEFVDEFTTRYAKRLSEGYDMRFIYEFELGCKETGLKCFYIDREYTNEDGKIMKVIDRREDMLIIEYDGDNWGVDYYHEDGVEYCFLDSDTRWSAIQPNEENGVTEREKQA